MTYLLKKKQALSAAMAPSTKELGMMSLRIFALSGIILLLCA